MNVDLLPIIFTQMRFTFDPRQMSLWQRQVTAYNGRPSTPDSMSYDAVCELVTDKMALYEHKPETARSFDEANLVEAFEAESFHLRAEDAKGAKQQQQQQQQQPANTGGSSKTTTKKKVKKDPAPPRRPSPAWGLTDAPLPPPAALPDGLDDDSSESDDEFINLRVDSNISIRSVDSGF